MFVVAGLETQAIRAQWLSQISNHLIFGFPSQRQRDCDRAAGAEADTAILRGGGVPGGGLPRTRSSNCSAWKR